MLYRLAYTSRSASADGLSPFTAAEILGHAQNTNQRRNITGCIVLKGPEILQVLEGSRGELERLLTSLQADVRHQDMRVLSFGPITKRAFAHPMNLCALADGLLKTAGIETLSQVSGQDIEPLIALHRAA